jgi:hypothetical protein
MTARFTAGSRHLILYIVVPLTFPPLISGCGSRADEDPDPPPSKSVAASGGQGSCEALVSQVREACLARYRTPLRAVFCCS